MSTGKSQIQEELRQSKPFASRAQEAVIGLVKTASVIQRRFATLIEPHGITLQQYNVLRILRGADAPLPTMEIGQRMIEDTPGITRLIDRLEAKGLVGRDRHPEDRRQVLCSITKEGRALLRKLDRPVNSLDNDALSELTESELETLIALLDRVRRYYR